MKRKNIVNTINKLSGEEGHKTVIKVYNQQEELPRGYKLQKSDPWCAATVTAVFLMNDYDGFAECSCPVMIQKAKALGIWQENDGFRPQVGDVLMYDWQDTGKGDDIGTADHVGIVIKVDGDTMTVREGNKNGSVGNRSVKINGRYIRGFITPPYEAEEEQKEQQTANSTPAEEKPVNEADSGVKQDDYTVGKTYTVNVNTALNVRRGAGKNYPLVGYAGLTSNAKKHATKGGALKNGTRVDCLAVEKVGNDIWMLIPSGWICAKCGRVKYVK